VQIGVLKETKEDEHRVALQPHQARILANNGHRVYVEEGAGAGAGYPDLTYREHSATIAQKSEILANCTLLLKVKAPLRSEFSDYNSTHTLFCYLHFDENMSSTDIVELSSSGFLGIAYEWVGQDGHQPLLEPMSRLTGYLFAQKSLDLCAQAKGTFCARNEDFLAGGSALIIGTGNIGLSAFSYFSDLRIPLTILSTTNAEGFNQRANARFRTNKIDYLTLRQAGLLQMDVRNPQSTKDRLCEFLRKADIVLNCAVRRPSLPKSRMEFLIDREMVDQMQSGSVLCDTTACDHDLLETCVSSSSLQHSYFTGGVVHYNCDHIPSLVARTSSQLLCSQTFPYVLDLANKGVGAALCEDERLRNGVCCYLSHVTHRPSAAKKGLPYRDVADLLGARSFLDSAASTEGGV